MDTELSGALGICVLHGGGRQSSNSGLCPHTEHGRRPILGTEDQIGAHNCFNVMSRRHRGPSGSAACMETEINLPKASQTVAPRCSGQVGSHVNVISPLSSNLFLIFSLQAAFTHEIYQGCEEKQELSIIQGQSRHLRKPHEAVYVTVLLFPTDHWD